MPPKRNRIDEVDAGLMVGASVGIDGVKGFFVMIPVVGLIINWVVISPVSYIGMGMWLNLHHDVSFFERGVWRVVWYILFGAIPASTTIGTAVTIVGVWVDDARYNASQVHETGSQKQHGTQNPTPHTT